MVTRPAKKTKRDVMTSHPQSLRMYRKENNIEHAQQPALEVQLRLTKTGEDNNTFLSFNFDRGKDMGGPNKKKVWKRTVESLKNISHFSRLQFGDYHGPESFRGHHTSIDSQSHASYSCKLKPNSLTSIEASWHFENSTT